MTIRPKVALAILGSRVERGEEVEVSEKVLATLDPADYDVVTGAPAPAEEEPAADVPVEEMTLPQLKERAKELGLSASGSKADLQERISLASGAPAPAEEEDGE